MAVRIGHASQDIDKNGNVVPAAAQVKIGDWYIKEPWYVVLRPKTLELAAKSAAICEVCCDQNDSGKAILYSQSKRNTLKQEALKAAGFSDSDDAKLSSVTTSTIQALNVTCYADCSSFMTFCAVCGGAKFSYAYYGTNAPTCSVMKSHFTSTNDYEALTSDEYLSEPDYLQRGDILVCKDHTVMVLDDGSKAPKRDYSSITSDGATVANNAYIDITTLMIKPTIKTLTPTTFSTSLTISKIEKNIEKELDKVDELTSYTWNYILEDLEKASNKPDSGKLSLGAAVTTHTLNKLVPNKSYKFIVTAEKTGENIKLQSASIIFTTPQAYPTAITNLKVTADAGLLKNKKFNISFTAPDSWGNDTLQQYYRTILFVNGKNVAYSDSLIAVGTTIKNKSVTINQFKQAASAITNTDVVQIGILPMLKDSKNNIIYDPASLRCSQPFIMCGKAPIINKGYLNVKNAYKRILLYSNILEE